MLGLKLATDPRWVNIVEKSLEEILIDHAYCEQKAASSCISMIIKYASFKQVVDVLTPIVAEEWAHFERVLEQLYKRGFQLGLPRKDEYVVALQSFKKKGGSREDQLLEDLLVNALIEARSCERFKLLHQELRDTELKNFYYELMVSEAGHYTNFIRLAKHYLPEDQVDYRWEEFLKEEARILNTLALRPDRVH